jgi:hypothetical protein
MGTGSGMSPEQAADRLEISRGLPIAQWHDAGCREPVSARRIAAQEAVDLYQKLAEQMWSRAAKGVSGAALLRKCLKEPQN